MTSAIPGALNALFTLWTAALPTVDIRDLQNLTGDAGTPSDNIWRRVNVGWVPETDESVTFTREWASAGRRVLTEDFDIPCSLECISGDEDLTALRDAAFTLLDELSAALAIDNTLGGLVMQGAAVLGNGALTPTERDSGGSVELRFTVHCETRIAQ